MRRRGVALVGGVLVAGLALAGCTGDADEGPGFSIPVVGPADVDVDTPQLRAEKEEAGIEPCPASGGDVVDGGLPALTLECFGGGRDVTLSGLRGPLAINVWAQWCTPCRNEIPELQAFHEEHGDDVALLGIDYQDVQAEDAMTFLRERGATYPQIADPGAETDGIGDRPRLGLPTMILVDEDGRVVYAEPTVIESPDDLEDLVVEHLGVDL